ncbi:cbb3-type cytochrome c oxidase subunit 3 [Pontibacter sp. G13]|uniref:cbb3-type cytochrome c oxidase subunit 3 n=1 Tax=Pontibacter sp. G13 TaxID=3074898 RepID=UPI00288B72A3|nr:cbb3-type cytochrome c oxidase subunit 3 [Pontibacter sp. G13]WNJ16111.1 cbb3-type cytochrome c oxidase subunit 3 [Pontibacter sp. G13]
MYKDVLRSIDGASLFPVIAILIFVGFFALIVWYAYFRLKKNDIHQMSSIPLDDNHISTPRTPLSQSKT